MSRIEFEYADISSSIKEFCSVVEVIAQLLNDNNAKILFGYESTLKIEIDDKAFSVFKIKRQLFNKILEQEIIPILQAILSDSEKEFIGAQVRSKRRPQKEKKIDNPKFVSNIEKRIEILKGVIINNDLISRYIIKSTTKLKKIKAIDWEINQKLFDNTTDIELECRYATISIKVFKEINDEDSIFKIFPFIQTNEIKTDELLFDCDTYDIDNIICILKKIKEKL